MNKYYKGKIFLFNDVCEQKYNIDCLDNIVDTSNYNFMILFNQLDSKRKKIVDNYFSKSIGNSDEVMDALNIMKEKIDFHIPYIQEIIYEILEDSDGNFYGKELITKNIFPVLNKNISFSLDKTYKKPFYLRKNGQDNILTIADDSREYYIDKIFYEAPLKDKDNIKYNVKMQNGNIIAVNGNNEFLTERKVGRTRNISFKLDYVFDNLEIGNCFVTFDDVITLSELKNYYNKYKKGLKEKRYTKLISKLAEKNVYRNNFEFMKYDKENVKVKKLV